jgi:hypothetical protein
MKKVKSLQRMLDVQEDLRRLAEARQLALRLRQQDLQGMENQIIQSLTHKDPRDVALAHMAGDRLRWLDRDLMENQAAQSEAQAEMHKIMMRKLTCERMFKRAQDQKRVDDERRSLANILDELQARFASFE